MLLHPMPLTSILILSSHLSLSTNLSHSLRFSHQNSVRASTPSERRIRDKNLLIFRRVNRISKAIISIVRPSVLPQGTNRLPLDVFFVKFLIWRFLDNLSIKSKFHYNLTKMTCTLNGDLFTFMIESRLILLRIRNVFDKICRKNQNTNFTSHNFFFFLIVPLIR
jgi:hypothetical protein